MGTFALTTRSNGEFQFNLIADNGKVVLTSEGYSTKAACENGIESVKKNAEDDARYEMLNASDGRPYFNLKAANGQVIGTSQMYADDNSRSEGIASVKAIAASAAISEN